MFLYQFAEVSLVWKFWNKDYIKLSFHFSYFCKHFAKMARKKEAVKEELRNITTLNLIASTSNVLEKLLWALIAIFGTLFIYEVVVIQLDFWNENPILISRQTTNLADMPLPSMTFCHKGLQKYGPVEQLANWIDPEKKIPTEVLAIRNEFLSIQYSKINKYELEGTDSCEWLFNLEGDRKVDNLILRGRNSEELSDIKSGCLVSNLNSFHIDRVFISFFHVVS